MDGNNEENKTTYKNFHCVNITVKQTKKGLTLKPGYKDASRVKQFVLDTVEYGEVAAWLSQSKVEESDLGGFNLRKDLREDLPMVNFLAKYPFVTELNKMVKKGDLKGIISFTEKNKDGSIYKTMTEEQFMSMAIEGTKDYNKNLVALEVSKKKWEEKGKTNIPEDSIEEQEHDSHEEKDGM